MKRYEKDFNKQVIKNLKTKGISIIGATWAPDSKGDFLNGETAYRINDNGTSKLVSYLDVIKMAQ